MKRLMKFFVVLVLVALLLPSCSRKGVHMSKHRKSRHCNCPTFAYGQNHISVSNDLPSYDSGGTI